MQTRKLGPFEISALGLGCMSLSHAYGTPPDPETAGEVLLKALDLGYSFIDTAALYGFGANETLIGNVLKHRRGEYVLASKCGMFRNAQGLREVDGRPEILTKTCEDSLKRLQTDVIDLYYLHRWDKRVPIEDSIGAMSDMVKQGKVKTIGLSEVSAETLRKAHRVHPITAVQTEYSLWTRNPEIAVLDACRELGVAFVAFSPLARGFPDRRAARHVHASAQGHPPRHAAFPGRAFPEQPQTARRFFGNRARERLHHGAIGARLAARRKRRTSFPFPAPRGSIISPRMRAARRFGFCPTRWSAWTR